MSSTATVKRQRNVQQEVVEAEARVPRTPPKAMQAGARVYPEPPFPKQHQAKPGHEHHLEPAPLYDAPFYKGSGKLDESVALITGGDSVAVLFAREGADVAIAHLAEDRDAEETKAAVEAEGRSCLVPKGDVRESGFCREAVTRTIEQLGKLDVLVNNAAFQVHTEDIADLRRAFRRTLKTNLYGYLWRRQQCHTSSAARPSSTQGRSRESKEALRSSTTQ